MTPAPPRRRGDRRVNGRGQVCTRARTAPRSARPAPASRVPALRGSARARPAEGGRRSPRSRRRRPRAPRRRRPGAARRHRRGRAGSAPSRRRRRCPRRRARGSRADCSTAAQYPARSCARRARRAWAGRRTRSPAPRAPRASEDVEIADDERPASDDRERRARRDKLGEARAREPEPSLGGLVRVGRGAERDLLALPRRRASSRAEHLGDVRLDADRAAVAVVRGTLRPLLEVPDVAERAAVDATHVRVERPPKRHAAHLRERRLAWLDPILDPHRPE